LDIEQPKLVIQNVNNVGVLHLQVDVQNVNIGIVMNIFIGIIVVVRDDDRER